MLWGGEGGCNWVRGWELGEERWPGGSNYPLPGDTQSVRAGIPKPPRSQPPLVKHDIGGRSVSFTTEQWHLCRTLWQKNDQVQTLPRKDIVPNKFHVLMEDFHNMTSITLLHCSTLPEDWHLLVSGQSRTLPRRLSLSCQQAGVCNGWDHLLLKVLEHIKENRDHLKLVVYLTTSTLCFSCSWQPQPLHPRKFQKRPNCQVRVTTSGVQRSQGEVPTSRAVSFPSGR